MNRSPSRCSLLVLTPALVALCGFVGSALAQAPPPCFIEGNTTGPAPLHLCGPGPSDNYYYYWEGPGTSATSQCIDAMQSGKYKLYVADGVSTSICSTTVVIDGSPPGPGPTCYIKGETTICKGSSTVLCGPEDMVSYFWTGPQGTATTQCITAFATGTYSLTISDGVGKSTCMATVVLADPSKCGSPPKCFIKGETEICPGGKTTLCGPGNVTWHWTGPGGFEAFSQCITVSTTGEYVLTVGSGGTTSSCRVKVVTVTDGSCGTGFDCPRTPGFWVQQCAQRGNGSTKYSAADLARITGCLFDASSFFTGDPVSGFCAAIDPPRPMDQRKQAIRQFASFAANLCAERLEMLTRNGERVGLDPGTVVICGGREITIGDLFDDVDAHLAALAGADLSNNAVKASYGAIISCLDAINNGKGLRLSCDTDGGIDVTQTQSARPSLDGNTVQLYRPYPNPFSGTTRIAFGVDALGAAVRIGVYDLSGRIVRPLVAGFVAGGRHETSWDGTDAAGTRVRPGVYFIRATIGTHAFGSQVLFVK